MPIDARGQFDLVAPTGTTLSVHAQGDVLRMDAPGWADVTSLTPASFLSLRRSIRSAASALLMTGLRFELSIDGQPAFAIGSGVKPTLLARVLGLRASRFSLRRVPVLRLLR